ncbi:MAG: alkylhydroperoxidase [Azoarcus sp.]|nr:MAG: alkylhydroperoxidase [Azoarcus sp.]
MTDRSISRFPVPELAELPEDIRNRILAVQEKAGFIPNVFLMLAHRPAEFRAFFDYHDALMEKDVGLSKAEREMIVVATSGVSECLYCVVAHGAVLRIRAKNPRVADQLATNYRKAESTPRQRAMLDFAIKLSTRGGEIEAADMDALREHGFDDEAIWDIGAITAFFSMSNRLVHLTGTPPNEQFYLMGRMPKA